MLEQLMERLEKAKIELDKAYQMADWDWILSCSMDVYCIQREIEKIG